MSERTVVETDLIEVRCDVCFEGQIAPAAEGEVEVLPCPKCNGTGVVKIQVTGPTDREKATMGLLTVIERCMDTLIELEVRDKTGGAERFNRCFKMTEWMDQLRRALATRVRDAGEPKEGLNLQNMNRAGGNGTYFITGGTGVLGAANIHTEQRRQRENDGLVEMVTEQALAMVPTAIGFLQGREARETITALTDQIERITNTLGDHENPIPLPTPEQRQLIATRTTLLQRLQAAMNPPPPPPPLPAPVATPPEVPLLEGVA
jgi:hypothetical protein